MKLLIFCAFYLGDEAHSTRNDRVWIGEVNVSLAKICLSTSRVSITTATTTTVEFEVSCVLRILSLSCRLVVKDFWICIVWQKKSQPNTWKFAFMHTCKIRLNCLSLPKVAYLASKLSYLGERSESRENARASGEAARGRGKAPRSRVLARLA